MAVQIHNMRSRIELLSRRAGGSSGADSGAADPGDAELKEALRPLVIELLEEELDRHMRSRG